MAMVWLKALFVLKDGQILSVGENDIDQKRPLS